MIADRMLLKSCATPPASVPSASSFCAPRSCASSSARALGFELVGDIAREREQARAAGDLDRGGGDQAAQRCAVHAPSFRRQLAHRALASHQRQVARAFLEVRPERQLADALADHVFLAAAEQALEAVVHVQVTVRFEIGHGYAVWRSLKRLGKLLFRLEPRLLEPALLGDVVRERHQALGVADADALGAQQHDDRVVLVRSGEHFVVAQVTLLGKHLQHALAVFGVAPKPLHRATHDLLAARLERAFERAVDLEHDAAHSFADADRERAHARDLRVRVGHVRQIRDRQTRR